MWFFVSLTNRKGKATFRLSPFAFCLFFMRYFAELAYNGTRYCGWQRQHNALSVQEKLEDAMSAILGGSVETTGCGRTDAGVHASQFFLHFDWEGEIPDGFTGRLNRMLPPDIALYRVFEVEPEAHARFDAVLRSYEYHIALHKDPFRADTSWHFPFFSRLDLEKVQQAAALLMEYESFFPFCKTGTDAKTMRCALSRSEWLLNAEAGRFTFHISADRFLRGMVRMIVGMCLNVGLGQITLDEVRRALEQQERLKKSYSVPPNGLFLTGVSYP